MKNIYTFGRKPAKRNFTVKDLQDLKGSGKRLTMCNPANEIEIRACVDAGIDTLTVWDRDIELARELAPTHFVGSAMGWGQFITHDEILNQAEIQMKYQGYIEREQDQAEKMNRLEGVKIPTDLDFRKLNSLSSEAKEKLTAIRPITIGQASRVSGVSPSDVSVLLIYMGR